MDFLSRIDIWLFQWFNSWAGISYFFDWAIIFRATYILYIIVMVAVSFLAVSLLFPRFKSYRRRNIEFFVFVSVATLIARFGITELIRMFYNRPRPFEVLDGVVQLVNHSGGGSFPSGHATFSFALATAIIFYYPKTGILFLLAAFSIGMGRIAAGLHWPSDVLVGALIGVGTALFLRFILRRKLWIREP